MTREEATDIFRRYMTTAADTDVDIRTRLDEAAKNSVSAFVALGMLKLDEPKSAIERLKEVWTLHQNYLPEFLVRLDAAGLKIVEK